MRFLSVCSGIEAASVAWKPLGWKAVGFSEIEPFPCAVLAHHYPDVPNFGDMTKFKEWPDVAIDLLCGGTPCQSFSVAGLRKGLADPRGNLMLTFGAIAARFRPEWLVWENVPGVLSSNGGRDFGSFLGLLGELGYGFAYRVLDAQYAGLAQRRKRVFVVGCLGSWQRAAAVLFERHSLQGHPAPSREARAGVAVGALAGTSPGGGWRIGADEAAAGQLVPQPHAAVSPALKARDGKGPSSDGDGDGAILVPMVAHALRADGFDASEDGTGRGTQYGEKTGPLDTDGCSMGIHAGMKVRRLTPLECERLQGFPDGYTAIPTSKRNAAAEHEEMRAYYLRTGQAVSDAEIRRMAADGPRYKALGNSWAAPVVSWVGRRIDMVNAIQQAEAA